MAINLLNPRVRPKAIDTRETEAQGVWRRPFVKGNRSAAEARRCGSHRGQARRSQQFRLGTFWASANTLEHELETVGFEERRVKGITSIPSRPSDRNSQAWWQGCLRFLPVGEVIFGGAEDLVILVATGDQQPDHRRLLPQCSGHALARSALSCHQQIRAAGMCRATLVQDAPRIFSVRGL